MTREGAGTAAVLSQVTLPSLGLHWSIREHLESWQPAEFASSSLSDDFPSASWSACFSFDLIRYVTQSTEASDAPGTQAINSRFINVTGWSPHCCGTQKALLNSGFLKAQNQWVKWFTKYEPIELYVLVVLARVKRISSLGNCGNHINFLKRKRFESPQQELRKWHFAFDAWPQ